MQRMMKRTGWMAVAILALTACEKDPETTDEPTPVVVPATYDFENVSYAGQTDRLNQLEEMMEYVGTANEPGVTVDKDVLMDMFTNANDNGGGNFSFESSKQLKDKCFEPQQSIVEGYFTSLQNISASTATGENGVAGRIASDDGESYRLFDANGWEYEEVIEKTLMGAVFYYQATSVYLGTEKMDVDNEEVVEGEGTEMQHHWDEAFGYFGADTDFPEELEGLKYWAKYCNGRDAVLGTNESLGHALRKGRAAINVGRLDVRDEAIEEVREAWELVCAGTAIHYVNSSIDNIGNDYRRNHALSEAVVFINNLFYNEGRTVTQTELDEVLDLIGDNFYEVTVEDLTAARDKLAQHFDLENKAALL